MNHCIECRQSGASQTVAVEKNEYDAKTKSQCLCTELMSICFVELCVMLVFLLVVMFAEFSTSSVLACV